MQVSDARHKTHWGLCPVPVHWRAGFAFHNSIHITRSCRWRTPSEAVCGVAASVASGLMCRMRYNSPLLGSAVPPCVLADHAPTVAVAIQSATFHRRVSRKQAAACAHVLRAVARHPTRRMPGPPARCSRAASCLDTPWGGARRRAPERGAPAGPKPPPRGPDIPLVRWKPHDCATVTPDPPTRSQASGPP